MSFGLFSKHSCMKFLKETNVIFWISTKNWIEWHQFYYRTIFHQMFSWDGQQTKCINMTFSWKAHISVKLFLFDLKIWLQRSLNKGYRIDIVRFKYEFFSVTRILYELVNPLLRPPKNVDANISIISRWYKIPNIGFDRAKSALQNLLSHWIVLYSFSEIFRIYFETLFLAWVTCSVRKKPILDQWKLENYI